MKRIEAEQIIKDRVAAGDIGQWFCPLINANCNTRCACYEKLYVRTWGGPTDDESGAIYGDICTCHSLVGGAG